MKAALESRYLVRDQVLPVLQKENWEPIIFNNYSNFQTQIRDKLNGVSSKIHILDIGRVEGVDDASRKLIVVFDQFEQFLESNSKNADEDKKLRSWLHNFIESFIQFENTRMLLVVRKECYYDLRFLEVFVPPPIECFHLSGMRIEDPEGSIPTLRYHLSKAMNDDKAPDIVLKSLESNGEVSPVEAQIVGCVLENKLISLGVIDQECYTKQLGGKEGLVQEFFDTTLRSSPNPEIALQVLFALSIETRYRNHFKLMQIVGMIHQPKDEVMKCIDFLREQRLISLVETAHFQLAHDYLAERFHDLSGSELEPKQRDNILFFGDEIRKGHDPQMTTSLSRPRPFKIVSDWFMLFLAFLVTARLAGPLYGLRWNWFNSIAAFQPTYLGIDPYYLPVFISHLGWSFYVTISYRRVFSLLKEKPLGRFLSILSLFTCAGSVILAVFIPYFWIFSIGFGGFWIGVKFLQLSTIEGLSTISKNTFRSTGGQTVFNVLFAILLGGILGLYIQSQPPSLETGRLYILFSIPALAILTYSVYVVTNLHVSRKVSPIWIGMFDRRPAKTKEPITHISY